MASTAGDSAVPIEQGKIYGQLLNAANFGDLVKVQELLVSDVRWDINYPITKDGRTALHCAAMAGYVAVVKELIKAGANFYLQDNRKKTPLDLAKECNRAKAHRVFLRVVNNSLSLSESMSNNNWAKIARLIGDGAYINASMDHLGSTALHLAVVGCDVSVVGRLLKVKGVNVNAKNVYGETPLHYAAMIGSDEGTAKLDLLIEAGANINSRMKGKKGKRGLTPLSMAKACGAPSGSVNILANRSRVNGSYSSVTPMRRGMAGGAGAGSGTTRTKRNGGAAAAPGATGSPV